MAIFPFQKLIDEISVDSLTMFERLFFVCLFCFFFSFDMQQGLMGEGEVTSMFLTFECISSIWRELGLPRL